jgi:hypothetical protein
MHKLGAHVAQPTKVMFNSIMQISLTGDKGVEDEMWQ